MQNGEKVRDILRPTGERFDITLEGSRTYVVDTRENKVVTDRFYHTEFMARKVAGELNRKARRAEAVRRLIESVGFGRLARIEG